MTIGQRIAAFRKEKSLSQQRFADEIGVSRSYLANVENDNQEPSFAFVNRLFSRFDTGANWLFGFNEKLSEDHSGSDFVTIKRVPYTVSAGHGALVTHDDGADLGTGSYAFNRRWLARRGLNPDKLNVMPVVGDSMEPDLSNGDLVLMNRGQTEPIDGRAFVVRFDDELFVKKLQKQPPRQLHLISTNAAYPPIVIDLERQPDVIQIIGEVVASMHEW